MEIIRLNFATHKQPHREMSRIVMGLIVTVLVIASAGNLYMGARYRQHLKEYSRKVKTIEDQVAAKAGQSPALSPQEMAALEEKVHILAGIIANDVFPWTKVLSAIETKLPPDTRIEMFSKKNDTHGIQLSGSAGATRSVTDLIAGMNSLPCFTKSRLLKFSIRSDSAVAEGRSNSAPVIFLIETELVLEAVFPRSEYGNLGQYLTL